MSEGRPPVPQVKTTLPPASTGPGRARARERGVIDAQFRVVGPVGRLWRSLRAHWWALGPYLAYCLLLWGLAALAGWLIDGR